MMKNKRLLNCGNQKLPKTKLLLSCLAVLFLCSLSGFSQTVKGVVTSDKDKMSLPGVTVSVKGSSQGVTTDFDGAYSIQAEANATLVFSYIGYATVEIPVAGKTQISVALKESANDLDEVVVIGYGTQKKSDLTGAVSVVNVSEAKKTITYDVAKMLQGAAPGVTVQSSGEPGGFVNIKIRGVTSFVNNQPLFVIDGMIVDSPYDFAPGEIESMQILKDASSAAIYGVRGANGVVIITTKKGKQGKISIGYRSMYGIQKVAKKWDVMNREQYQRMVVEAERNDPTLPTIGTGNYPNDPTYINNVDTDWQDAAFRTGTVENQSLTFGGGSEGLNYNFNVDYFKNESYIEATPAYKRLSAIMNINGTKGKFKYGGKLGYTQSDKAAFSEYVAGATPMSELILAIPTMPVYDQNRLGGFGGTDVNTQRAISLNVIGYNTLNKNNLQRNRFIGNVWGELEILKGLKYKISASADRTDAIVDIVTPPSDLGWYYVTTNAEANVFAERSDAMRTLLENILTYDFSIGNHKINALAGIIQEKNTFDRLSSRGSGYDPTTLLLVQNASLPIASSQWSSTNTNLSYLSRLTYGYDNRYLLQANFRRDRTSYFAPENNTGDFFSFSAGWNLSNEKWLKLPEWVSLIKLKGGYGELGNNTVGPYAFTSTTNPYAAYLFGNSQSGLSELAPGTTVVTLRDPDLVWETTKSTNFGIDLAFFQNKLQVSAEYFTKKTDDLLVNLPLPYSTGSFPATISTNAAAVENKGLEFAVSYSNNDKPFKYSISANLGTLKNEVTKIGEKNDPISAGFTSRTQVGRSIGEIFAYEAIGIFQSAEDVANSPTQTNAAPGDVKFRDANGDGEITADDRTFQGVTIPKYSYGLNFNCSYKGVDFSFMWQGAGGHKAYNTVYAKLMGGQYQNASVDMNNYWTPDNTNTNIPRPIIGDPNGNARNSSRFVEKADYIRLQNINLGYTLPLGENKYVQRARIYVSGQNMLTISNYKGYDPDFVNDGLLTRGEDLGSFPNPRTFAMGVEIDF